MFRRHLLLAGGLLLLCLAGAVASECDMDMAEESASTATTPTSSTGHRARSSRSARRLTHTGIDPSTIAATGSWLVLSGLALRRRRR